MSLVFSPDLFEAIHYALRDEAKENKNDILRKERERRMAQKYQERLEQIAALAEKKAVPKAE